MLRSLIGRGSIEWKLPIAICSLLVVVLAAFAWIAFLDVRRSAVDAAGERLQGLARQLSGILQTEAERAVGVLRSQAADRALPLYLRSGSESQRAAALDALGATSAQPERVVATELRDADGRPLLITGRDTTRLSRMAAEQGARMPVRGDSGGVGPFLALGDSIVIPTFAPVDDRGERLGYVVQWRYVSTSPKEREGTLRFIGPGASLFLGSPATSVWTDRTEIVPPPPVDITQADSLLEYDRPDVGRRLAVAALISGTPWVVLVEFSEHLVLAPARRFLTRVTLIALALFLVGLAGVWFLVRRITGPLRQLTAAAGSISGGDYSRRVRVNRSDELGRLGSAFDVMAERIQETHDRLEAKIAELRSAQEQFAHAQRMEAVGRLAGGVAHDFNNLLTVILGEADLALARKSSDPEMQASIKQIQQAGERAAILTHQLLAFSRKQLIEPTVFNANELVHDLDKMLTRLIGEDIQLVTRSEARTPSVRADRGQIEQVVMNLVVNARDAMPEGGRLVIETDNITLDEHYANERQDVSPGDYVMIAVSDTGTGMTDDVKAHVFEPFFTTKDRSKGTGLGLATSYGIVKQSGGHIGVYTEPGVGTTMRVYLPCFTQGAIVPTAGDNGLAGGHETILLVEDEVGVRKVAVRLLESQGYHVLEATEGDEALRMLRDQTKTIDLLLTDVVLPGMGGRELAEWAVVARPGIKVLFASGYTDDVILQHQLIERNVTILQKPFTSASLGRKVREVLDAAEREEAQGSKVRVP